MNRDQLLANRSIDTARHKGDQPISQDLLGNALQAILCGPHWHETQIFRQVSFASRGEKGVRIPCDRQRDAGLVMLTPTSHGLRHLPFPWYVLGPGPGNSGVCLQYKWERSASDHAVANVQIPENAASREVDAIT